jgi:ABC-type branched-subunit amino acid transport system substrate-binding protein
MRRSRTCLLVAMLALLAMVAVACSNSETTGSATDRTTNDTNGDDTNDSDTNGDTNSNGDSTNGDSTNGDGTGDDGTPDTTADVTLKVPSEEPGVTDTEIKVGGVTSETNPLGGNYGDAYDGVEAYFAMVNDGGGIYGRDLVLTSRHDDQVANNQTEVQALLEEDIFAVLPVATLLFTGGVDLAEAGIPTFGWNINPEWAEGPNLFGEKGSYLCFTCGGSLWPWVAQQLDRTKVGILAYGISEQSKGCAEGWRTSFETYPSAEVVFFDDTLAYGVPDVSGEVAEMKDQGVDLILTCMDQNGVVTVAREANRQDLGAIQFLSNAYDDRFVAEFGDLFEGSVVGSQFWPFEEETDVPEGMTNYQEWMASTGGTVNEISMAGWLSADLFVEGLKAAGPEFTQPGVVEAINQMTDWDANGLNAGFDWTIAHKEEQPDDCFSVLAIEDGTFVPAFTPPGTPFACSENGAPELVAPDFRS